MLKITARGFSLNENAKEGVQKELKRVEKMLPETAGFDVTISKKNDGYKCDVTVKDAGSFIRGEAIASRVEPSINLAVDDLKRKIRKLKTHLVAKKRKSGIDNIAKSMVFDFSADSDSESSQSAEIVRVKNISLQMMDDDEAIVQLEMLGHTYFVYIGVDGSVKVVYKRKNGYGLLICEK